MQFKEYIRNLPAYKPAKLTGVQSADVVKLSSNENVMGTSPRALAAMQAALSKAHLYPDSSAMALREALARHADVTPEMVLCSNGSDEMILLLCLAFLREGDDVVMAQGTFISYLLRTLEMGATPIRVPMRQYTHDLSALVDAVTPRTRLLFVCNPNNPTGTTVGEAEMRDLLQRVPDDVLVVADEAYIEYATRPDFPDLLPDLRGGRTNIILLRTFAKIYGLAGLRLGYAYGHPDVIDYLNRVRTVFNVNVLSQAAGVAALADQEHVERSRAHAETCRAFFERELKALGLQPVPTETNFVAVDVGDDAAVAEGLRTRNFTVTPLSGWGVPGCIRVSFGTMEQNERFIGALRDVLAEQRALTASIP
jgi:histidinol-phosphate aminotransferase